MARIRFTLGEIGAAELAAAEDPPRSDTHSDEGVARRHAQFADRLVDLGELEAALGEVQKSLAAMPTAPGYRVQWKVLSRQGKCKEAARALEMARRLDPKSGDAAVEGSRCTTQGLSAP